MFKKVFFYLIFLFVIIGSIWHIVKKQTLYIPSADLIALQSLDKKQYNSITLGLEPYRGVMLAANILGNVDLYFIEDSYLKKVEYRPERITVKNPLLTTADSCLRSEAIDFTKLTNKLILISKVRQLDRNAFFFNKSKSYCNGMKLHAVRGFSVTEEWGVWSEGERTEFTVEISEPYPRGGKLMIDVRPVINPNIVNDERIILVDVDNNYKKRFGFTSSDQTTIQLDFDSKDPGSKISVVINHINPIRVSDISGSDPHRISLGFLSAKLMSNGDNGQIRIASVTGAYGRESDGNNWWYWVERKVSFKLQPLFVPKDVTQTKLRFKYGTRGKQTLTLQITKRNGSNQKIMLQSKGDEDAMFEKIIDLPPIELAEVSIETDGKASPLGNGDSRVAAWVIRNLNINPVSP
jgi:hypothetical protein